MSRFDFDLCVIGGGAAGLSAARIAASQEARVALIEKQALGGESVRFGCVPSHSLMHAARIRHESRLGAKLGLDVQLGQIEFGQVMAAIQTTLQAVAQHGSPNRFSLMGVRCLEGEAQFLDRHRVQLMDINISARAFVIASGSQPKVPPIAGLPGSPHYTSHTLWNLRALPKRVIVLGGGEVGCQWAQAFARLGSTVHLIERGERLLPRETPLASELLTSALQEEGLFVHSGAQILKVSQEGGEWIARLRIQKMGRVQEATLPFDALLISVGRVPNQSIPGIERLNLKSDERGWRIDERLRTSVSNVFAAGDVVGRLFSTQAAQEQARIAVTNALFSPFYRRRYDPLVVPEVCYTDPEIASVGWSEARLVSENRAFENLEYDYAVLDRSWIERRKPARLCVRIDPKSTRVLGATIIGPQASLLILPWADAVKRRERIGRIWSARAPYPTYAQANLLATNLWRRERRAPALKTLMEYAHHLRG